MRKLLVVTVLLFSFNSVFAGSSCGGRFVNPITDICWSCMFPLSFGTIPLIPSPTGNPDTKKASFPLCACGTPIPRIGIPIGYWEPSSLTDVTNSPFCMVSMGFGMDIGYKMGEEGAIKSPYGDLSTSSSFKWVHWYKYPLIFWLQIIEDVACMQAQDFDIAYMAEIDPMWDDDALSLILNPEALLFSDPITQLSCGIEATKTASGFSLPMDSLFWCAGGQGSLYPLTGNTFATTSPQNNAVLLTERMNLKLHREGVIPESTSSNAGMCWQHYSPILPKTRYRYQFSIPVNARLCEPYSTTTAIREGAMGKSSLKGENFGLVNWRKRDCCVL